MSSVQYQLQRRLYGWILFKDSIGFRRPVDLSVGNTPAEPAGVAYHPSFSQESFATLQIGITASILQRYRCLRSQQLQHCDPVQRERARSQIVFQIEYADKFRLFDDGNA